MMIIILRIIALSLGSLFFNWGVLPKSIGTFQPDKCKCFEFGKAS